MSVAVRLGHLYDAYFIYSFLSCTFSRHLCDTTPPRIHYMPDEMGLIARIKLFIRMWPIGRPAMESQRDSVPSCRFEYGRNS